MDKGQIGAGSVAGQVRCLAKAYPELAAQYTRTFQAKMSEGWQKSIPTFPVEKPVATRNAGQVVMNAIEKAVPELFGGAADLTASTKTIFKDSPSFHVDRWVGTSSSACASSA